MAIAEDELKELIEPKGDIEKVTKISSDGNRLLVRVPKEIEEELSLKKGQKFVWNVNKKENMINLTISGATVLTGENFASDIIKKDGN